MLRAPSNFHTIRRPLHGFINRIFFLFSYVDVDSWPKSYFLGPTIFEIPQLILLKMIRHNYFLYHRRDQALQLRFIF